ncbi:MAG: phenylalanine--tRNA ligase subunit beta [Gammaproteobacteria bacterium]|nr:phenylalanine--tRNA ligase subunit beta [Gammaproteobacteria bacterium]
MRISINWLGEWLGVTPEPRELAARLTMAGLEIEAVEPAAPPLPGVVVGEIVEREKHPGADTLSVCKVSTGTEVLQIVCGAPNARAGMKAPLATIGAKLPGGMEIRKAKLRGVESFGMLCSARELGLSEDASGLMELPAEARTGANLVDALALEDTVLEVNLTPNRGDCMSVLGIAREAALFTDGKLTGPALHAVPAASADRFPVELEKGAGCARFAARVIRGVRPQAQAPLWMRERLRRAGLRPISAIVDVTNYVMLELGQPMHAYDLRELEGGIVVRRARDGEALKLLDGRDVTLDPSVMIIADRAKPLALAGVMGGDHSGITDATTDVLLEVAFFLPDAVAGRGRRYGLVTDASQRFERGVDPTLQERAIERATQLLLECAGGLPGPVEVTELRDELPKRTVVRFRPERARTVIGAPVADDEMARILANLGMDVRRGGVAWDVTGPPWRFDIAIEEDLVEEIARVYGFDRIPETDPAVRESLPPLTETRVTLETAADLLVQRGYHEAITYSFVDPALQALFCPGARALELANPIAADLAAMRLSLWPGLAKAVLENQRRQQPRVRLFEIGRRFDLAGAGLVEVQVVAGIAAGAALPEQWGAKTEAVEFFDVKGDVEALLRATGASGDFRFVTDQHPALHPGQAARILRDGRPVGWLGRLHPELERRIELTYSAVVFEIETESGLAARVPQHREISRFPAVRRDIAVIVDEAVTVQSLLETVRSSAGELLTELTVFDIYRGTGITPGRKSVAMGLNLQDISRTLTDVDTDAVVARVVKDLEREHKATIRDK